MSRSSSLSTHGGGNASHYDFHHRQHRPLHRVARQRLPLECPLRLHGPNYPASLQSGLFAAHAVKTAAAQDGR